ncbi:MAG TPA: zinc ribbon domain-containing protein [Candidatus Dormibacteraeota bacterium]
MATVTCNNCREDVPADAHFCPHCGAPEEIFEGLAASPWVERARRAAARAGAVPLTTVAPA